VHLGFKLLPVLEMRWVVGCLQPNFWDSCSVFSLYCS